MSPPPLVPKSGQLAWLRARLVKWSLHSETCDLISDTRKGDVVDPAPGRVQRCEDCLLWASVVPPEFQGHFQLPYSVPSLSLGPSQPRSL